MIRFSAKNVKPVGAYVFLGSNDVMQRGDLVRFTGRVNPATDYYDPDDTKRMNWHRIEDGLPAWIGRTLKEFSPDGRWRVEVIRKVQQ